MEHEPVTSPSLACSRQWLQGAAAPLPTLCAVDEGYRTGRAEFAAERLRRVAMLLDAPESATKGPLPDSAAIAKQRLRIIIMLDRANHYAQELLAAPAPMPPR